MEKTYSVKGGGGMNLHVREWGDPEGVPILFIHGWSQSHLSWRKQYESHLAGEFRLAALDLRGHGMSDAPLEAENYTEARLWADDIAAVIDRLDLDRPVLVAWSYGGLIVSDYIRAHGQTAIGGVNYVGGAVTLNEAAFGTFFGPGFLDYVEGATQPDLPTGIETMRAFLRGCAARAVPADDFERMLAFNMTVPFKVRAGLVARRTDSDDVLESMTVPVLATHGREDRVALPAMTEHVLNLCPTATASWYDGVGHMPFMEDAERFNAELSAFARRSTGTRR